MTSPNRAYPYPDINAAPAGPLAFENLADAVDADVQQIDDRLEAVETVRRVLLVSNGFLIAGGSVEWDVGPLSVDPTQAENAEFIDTTDEPNGGFAVTEAGVYSINFYTLPDGSPGPAWVNLATPVYDTPLAVGSTDGYSWDMSGSWSGYLPAGAKLRCRALFTSGRTCRTRIHVAKTS
jgi:hypothetical protein